MMALVGTLSFNFQVLLPLLARHTWHGTAATYALLTAAMGVGSVCGALAAGARGRVLAAAARRRRDRRSARSSCSRPPRRRSRCRSLALVPLGAMSVTFAAGVNSALQLAVDAGDARARDGALLGRLPRLDADRRAARRAGWPRSPARASGMALGGVRGAGRGRAGERRLRARRRAPGRQECRRGVESRRVLVDLHAHYPMHLIPPEQADTQAAVTARRPGARWKAIIIDLLSRRLNYQGPKGAPSVTVELMRTGDVGAVLSVLYSPLDEMDLRLLLRRAAAAGLHQLRLRPDRPRRAPRRVRAARRHGRPRPGRAGRRHRRRARRRSCTASRAASRLGATPAEIDANVAELARRGVAYVTLAHLFWRGVATNAPALPFLPDWLYRLVFRQPKVGLTELGTAAARAMVRERVLVDITHMSEQRDRRHLRRRRARRAGHRLPHGLPLRQALLQPHRRRHPRGRAAAAA